MYYSISKEAFAQGIMGNELLKHALSAYGFLLEEGKKTTLGKFADRIAEFYHVDEGRSKAVYDFLKSYSDVALSTSVDIDPVTLKVS